MAILTDVVRHNVVGRFAGRLRSVVATEAVVGDAGVGEGRGRPACRLMAILTNIAGRQVRG